MSFEGRFSRYFHFVGTWYERFNRLGQRTSLKVHSFSNYFFIMFRHAKWEIRIKISVQKEWSTKCWKFRRARLSRRRTTGSSIQFSHAVCILSHRKLTFYYRDIRVFLEPILRHVVLLHWEISLASIMHTEIRTRYLNSLSFEEVSWVDGYNKTYLAHVSIRWHFHEIVISAQSIDRTTTEKIANI